MKDDRSFLTTEETAGLLRVSIRQVKSLTAKGLLPAVMVGGCRRFHLNSLIRFILLNGNESQRRMLKDSGRFDAELEATEKEGAAWHGQ